MANHGARCFTDTDLMPKQAARCPAEGDRMPKRAARRSARAHAVAKQAAGCLSWRTQARAGSEQGR